MGVSGWTWVQLTATVLQPRIGGPSRHVTKQSRATSPESRSDWNHVAPSGRTPEIHSPCRQQADHVPDSRLLDLVCSAVVVLSARAQ
jgi:hypothetical protein